MTTALDRPATDNELIERFVAAHPRLDYSRLCRDATFYLCRDTWAYMALEWARMELSKE